MQCYTELTPPTAVTHSLSLPFLAADALNLVVAKTSLLQIFALKQISIETDPTDDTKQQLGDESQINERNVNDEDGVDSSFLGGESGPMRIERATASRLILIAEYPLSGTVTSLAPIKAQARTSGGDALLIAFKDAKISLLEWDPDRHGLSTISIHLYEQEDLLGSPWATKMGDCVSILTTDPGSRCAALKFGLRNLAILPFRQEDEDIAMEDWDEDLDGPRPIKEVSQSSKAIDDSDSAPYAPSFVLRLSALDPSLIHLVDLVFLHEYREPTFGVLSSTLNPSSALLHERKDHLNYMVFTLDLVKKASTTILVVGGLPYDLWKIIALPAPIGGALLVGVNELIHVDQAGKPNGVAVNVYAKQCTSFGLADQADLDMRLEDCSIEQLSIENGEMIIILNSSELALLTLRLDGRSVSGLSIRRVDKSSGGQLLPSGVSSTAYMDKNLLFVGNENGDSVLLGWRRRALNNLTKRVKPKVESAYNDDYSSDENEGNLDYDDLDDDLYGDALPTNPNADGQTNGSTTESAKSGELSFRIHDSLINIAPLSDITFGKPLTLKSEDSREQSDSMTGNIELVGVSGRGKSSALSILKAGIEPNVVGRFEFPEARGIWAISVRKPATGVFQGKAADAPDDELGAEALFDRLMIVSKATSGGAEESAAYALTSAGFEALAGTEFEPAAGATIEAGTLGRGSRLIQVLKSEVRSYDGDLGLAQILPMFDDDTGAEPKVVSASLSDPYLLLIRDDASIFVAQCDHNNELEELERADDALLSTKWITGCLYADRTNSFAPLQTDKGQKHGDNIFMFLLSANGALYIYALPNLSNTVFVAEGICFVPPVLSSEYAARRSTARETLTEILVADLGDSTAKAPYLILRTSSDDVVIYEPFRRQASAVNGSLNRSLFFLKNSNPRLAKNPDVSAEETTIADEEQNNMPMRALENVGGYSAVFLPGASPSFILKTAKSMPKVIGLQGAGVRGMSSFHTAGCDKGFIYADAQGVARVSQLPQDVDFAQLGMSLKKVGFGSSVHTVSYHSKTNCYVIGSSAQEDFELPKDEESSHRYWFREQIASKPLTERGVLKLVSQVNWSVIDTIELDPCETIMCIKTLNLEVSETTHEKKSLVTVGSVISKGEDLPVRGCIRVYDIVTVIPEPGRPETNKKLKLIAREDIPRGAITGISEIGSQGFMIVAQGQKLMVRGLKEDGTLLPVAFMDVNCYVTALKELGGSGLCVVADAFKGVWLTGYNQEPYRMTLFGKSAMSLEVVAADLLPDGEELYIVAADADGDLHILQYDPEHPKSLQGHLLLHRTTFALGGHIPSTMTLLPRTKPATILPASPDAMDIAAAETIPEHQILITSISGCISLLSPLSESQYRRLSILATHLSNTLPHACGLNPKAYRTSREAPDGMLGGRAVVDGSTIMRWMELGSQRRAEIAGRAGVGAEEIRDDLQSLVGGLNYL